MNSSRGYRVLGAAGVGAMGAFAGFAWVLDLTDYGDAIRTMAIPAPYLFAGLLAVGLRPRHAAARRLVAFGALHEIGFACAGLALVLAAAGSPVAWLPNASGQLAYGLGFVALTGMAATFPTGTYTSRRVRTVVRGYCVLAIAIPIAVLVASTTHPVIVEFAGQPIALSSPVSVGLADLRPLVAPLAAAPVMALVLLVARYRRSGAEDRLRMRWPLAGALLLPAGIVTSPVLEPVLGSTVWSGVFFVLSAGLPLGIFVGIVRHRLFDVDQLIRRGLVYATLWVVIALAFVVASAAAEAAAGSTRLSVRGAIVLAAVTAALFQPTRARLERLADRWLFGRRPDNYGLVRRLGESLEATIAIDSLPDALARVLQEGFGTTWARVKLLPEPPDGSGAIPGPQADEVAVAGIAAGDELAVMSADLTDGSRCVGVLELGPRVAGELGPHDEELLRTLAQQAALAVGNARLTAYLREQAAVLESHAAELRASRRRIVHAQEAERRHIHRNIHDGVQQQLVALLSTVELMRTQSESREERLGWVREQLRQVISDVRELSTGIHPAVLNDRGLPAAVASLASRLPPDIEVRLDVDPSVRDRRFPEDIEGAGYFVVSEAMANSLKHARCRALCVGLGLSDGWLEIVIGDDGSGFDPALATGTGLSGLADRVEALGGRVAVESRPGDGTRVVASLPAP